MHKKENYSFCSCNLIGSKSLQAVGHTTELKSC